ncbi:hypothetical protein [Roseateles puraquae]|uniref:hypothetical protein n=1 Tax=Roseateles puraquae TaxID=431059 RepID=UPI0031DC3498
MEVEVWQLRRDGAKLPEAELDGPYRGWLRLARYNIAGQVTLHADLRLGAGQGAPSALLGLTCVEVRRLDERGILLYGLQAEGWAGPAAVRQRQAWFCRPVQSSAGTG